MQIATSGTSPARVWRVDADSGEVLGTRVKNRAVVMKVAISSTSFAQLLDARDLTQLEWLESCASQLGADGVVFDHRHFARTDSEYIAQLKKVTIDLGLVPLAVAEPRLFDATVDAGERLRAVELAAQVGAFFVIASLPASGDVPPAAFVAAVGAAKAAVRAAKAVNVTLLVETAPASLAPDVPALRHFIKDVDSAWLRYALPAGASRGAWGVRDRALLITIPEDANLDGLAEVDEAARPWLLLGGGVHAERIQALRRAAAKKTLVETGVF